MQSHCGCVRLICMEQSVYMSVKRTRQGQKETLFAIYRTSTRADYTETLGHGSIQQLQACSANANVAFLAASRACI